MTKSILYKITVEDINKGQVDKPLNMITLHFTDGSTSSHMAHHWTDMKPGEKIQTIYLDTKAVTEEIEGKCLRCNYNMQWEEPWPFIHLDCNKLTAQDKNGKTTEGGDNR